MARANLDQAGVADRVDDPGRAGARDPPALAGEAPFDLVFIDADKANIPAYFDWAVELGRPGTVIVVDNVVRNGALLDSSGEKPDVVGVRRLHDLLATSEAVTATTIQTVGTKGYDGFTLAVVTAP